MTALHSSRIKAGAALLAGGAVWPSVYGALTALALSPLERAMAAAWCGAAPHDASVLLGHCAACWAGSAAFAAAAALALLGPERAINGSARAAASAGAGLRA